MKKRKLSTVVFGSFLLVIVYLVYTQAPNKDNIPITQLTQEEQIELEVFLQSLQKEGGFFTQVGKELRRAGYSYQTAGMINSKDDIRLIIIIPDNEVVTKQKKAGVKKIYKDMIIKSDMDLKAFKIQVGHIDDLSW